MSDVDESEDRRGDGVTRSITVCDDERPFSTSLQFPYFGAKNKNIVYMCSFEKKLYLDKIIKNLPVAEWPFL